MVRGTAVTTMEKNATATPVGVAVTCKHIQQTGQIAVSAARAGPGTPVDVQQSSLSIQQRRQVEDALRAEKLAVGGRPQAQDLTCEIDAEPSPSFVRGDGTRLAMDDVRVPDAASVSECQQHGVRATRDESEERPARVHTGEVCTAMPAPHSSDGGVRRQEPSSSVYRGPVALESKPREQTSKVPVRMPTTAQRRKALQAGQIHAYASSGPAGRAVTLSQAEAERRAGIGMWRSFSESSSLHKNIRAAQRWVATGPHWAARSVDEHTSTQADQAPACQLGEREPQARDERHRNPSKCQLVRLSARSLPFTPSAGNASATRARAQCQRAGRASCARCDDACIRVVTKTAPSSVDLRDVLRHKQMSHVKVAPSAVRRQMDEYCTCAPKRMTLDLRGKTASKMQRDLRAQLVQDLKAGNDEAAFVCSQLGIDNAPRADQLELMIAAMPGVKDIVFEGPPVRSGLDISEWIKGHASHCDRCKEGTISEDCYFRVVHHFLLRGFEPTLKPGEKWEKFRTKTEAYISAWNQESERCKVAWEKWVRDAEGLLSEPTSVQPKFVVPILPAARAKHVWRFLVHGVPYKIRLCLDLKAAGVNASTEDWKFRYRGLDDVAAKVRRGDWLASVDISRFYLRLPAGPGLRSAQWVQDPTTYGRNSKSNRRSRAKKWRQLQAIGFGLKTAPAWASVVSAELVRILEAEGIRVVGCFIDDILIAGATKEEAAHALKRALSIMEKLGIPANEKTVEPRSPSEGIVFLGCHIRTSDMRFSISAEFKDYAIDRIQAVLRAKKASKGDLASIAGVLTWISYVFIPGKPRRQFIYDAARLGSSAEKSDIVDIQGALQRQLQWWRNTLSSASFLGTRIWEVSTSPRTTLMQSDASGEDGWGACILGLHFAGPWPEELRGASMLFKEMVPVTIVLALLCAKVPETVFGIAVDNTGVAFAVNKLNCRDKLTARLLQQVTSDLDSGGHTALGAHVRRARNVHTDILSHALSKCTWATLAGRQAHSRTRVKQGYWYFQLVAQNVVTGECYSGIFKMRKSLFAKWDEDAAC